MKVLQLTTHLKIGGIASYILSLTRALKKRGVESLVVSGSGDIAKELENSGIRHTTLDIRTKSELSPKVFFAIFRIARLIKEERIDIVHAHTRVSQTIAFFACRMAGVPFVTTCHGFFKVRMRKIFDTWGAKVIAISEGVKGHLVKDMSVDGSRIEVIYTGVDIGTFSRNYSPDEIAHIKREFGLKEGVTVVGTIGRLSPVKGQKFFIEAVKDVISAGEPIQGVIIGDGDEERPLRKLARDLSLHDSVIFARSDMDTPKCLAAMDVFVFPSLKEGLGLSLLEAMASAKPCVASDVGGIRDIIKDGSNGILTPAGDRGRIAEAILQLKRSPDLQRRLGLSARETVRERFSVGMMAEKTADMYKDVLRSYAVT